MDRGTDADPPTPGPTTLHAPTHRETLWALEEAFGEGALVTVFGRCTVEYEGRAASSLGPGDRLLILKPDGSALVHTDENQSPVNWQPPGSEHRAAVRDGRLRVRSTRENPDERLDVRFERVHQFSGLPVTGGRSLEVTGSEADLKRRVLERPDLVEAGFTPLATERESAAGPIDVYGEDAEGTPVVVELKRKRVGPDAVGQLKRYVEAVSRERADDRSVRGLLVAPSVTDRARAMLEHDGLEFVAMAPPVSEESAESAESDSSSDSGESSDPSPSSAESDD
ncbi:endonuclease NucS [Halobium salinum]|uniref:Endonuclease NucS n=1 Tax=Halobium salinum TaxID=1364940 RepID=A0ABD5PD97_9EURY|nr:endonuclease NucS [Halobium salinum]